MNTIRREKTKNNETVAAITYSFTYFSININKEKFLRFFFSFRPNYEKYSKVN